MKKIITYLDTGANITKIKPHWGRLGLIRHPYDSDNRPKKKGAWEPSIAKPSGRIWKSHTNIWEGNYLIWKEHTESDIYPEICKIVGPQNLNDILHLDSAYKSEAKIFLTSDNKDIKNKRSQLEKICDFKIFNPTEEHDKLVSHINLLCS